MQYNFFMNYKRIVLAFLFCFCAALVCAEAGKSIGFTEEETELAKVTAFLDADNPYDGFTPVKETVFETPVMYAGNSTATEKRVTFGRNKILSGDVYVLT